MFGKRIAGLAAATVTAAAIGFVSNASAQDRLSGYGPGNVPITLGGFGGLGGGGAYPGYTGGYDYGGIPAYTGSAYNGIYGGRYNFVTPFSRWYGSPGYTYSGRRHGSW